MSKVEDGSRRREVRAKPAAAAPRGNDRRAPSGIGIEGRPPLDRRGQILHIAAKHFAEFGYGATTIRKIADSAQILSGSIYHHFDTKDEILDGIIRDAVAFIAADTIRIANAACDPEIKLVALILLSLRELTRDQEAHSILYNERRFLRHNPNFAYVAKFKIDMYCAWQAVIEEGSKSGRFKPSIDVFLTISTIVRMLNTCADWFKHEGNYELDTIKTYSLEEVIDFNIDFILRAIRIETRIGEPIPREAAARLVEERD